MADYARISAVFTIVIVAAVSLSGCSSADEPSAAAASLATTKSPVQLLRNEAASRIPTAAIESVTETGDESKACLDEDDDPLGLERSWNSSAQVLVKDAAAWRIDTIVDAVAQSFVDQGWRARPLGGSPTSRVILLSSESSPAEIQLSANRPDPDAPLTSTAAPVEAVTIDLSVHGPCVTTEGPESDAVKKLEGRS